MNGHGGRGPQGPPAADGDDDGAAGAVRDCAMWAA
jgi:hypothetical protein